VLLEPIRRLVFPTSFPTSSRFCLLAVDEQATRFVIRQDFYCLFRSCLKVGLSTALRGQLHVPREASPRVIARPNAEVGEDVLSTPSAADDRALAATTTGCIGTWPLNAVPSFVAASTTRRFRGSFGGTRMIRTGDFSCTTVGPVAFDQPVPWLPWVRDGFFPALATRPCLRRLPFDCLPIAD
jgi:hypothetical protein